MRRRVLMLRRKKERKKEASVEKVRELFKLLERFRAGGGGVDGGR